ncbi:MULTISPECIES: response regulator transcription factor [Enterobacter]|uniref:response regulator transcription factor n=1 Tax=Enterobacter TaxID=547 RepID=UPI0018888AEE|nr:MULTISPECIES: response regulator [Enterobacter]MBF2789125.1 response regulator transcription factor [Enterobacter asburiae]
MEDVVYVIDDDDAYRLFVVKLLMAKGYQTFDFKDAEEFLSFSIVDRPSCLILEINTPHADGFEVIDALKERGCTIPIVILTKNRSIPLCVRAMKAGVRDFLTKPVEPEELIDVVKDVLNEASHNFLEQQRLFELCKSYHALTRREKQIFELAINGLQNKQIASELGISEITVKVHRRRVMDKMQVRTLADLVHAAGTLQIGKSHCPPRKNY